MLARVHFCRAEKTLGGTESHVIGGGGEGGGRSPRAGSCEDICTSAPGIPSRHRERPVMETWMASLGSGTTEWSTQMTSMMFTVMLKN